jgi:hypothetical protein
MLHKVKYLKCIFQEETLKDQLQEALKELKTTMFN